jgi:asparagine synthase (glutamine-hydrolysing)
LDKNSLIFASEIKSLLLYPGVKKDLDMESINNFLTFRHIPSPYTIFENIRRINPISVIVYNNNELQEKNLNYFKINKVYGATEKDVLEGLHSRLDDAVIKRLGRVKDAGLFLSGGLDSSALLYYLNKELGENVKTYTVSLLRDGYFARGVSNYFKCKYTEYDVSTKDLLNILPKVLWHFEYPVNGPDSFQYYLSKISEGQKYIFWGRGSEELFYGRLDYVALRAILKFKKFFPLKFWQALKPFAHRIPNRNILCKLLNIILAEDIYDIYISFREVLTRKEKEELLDEKVFKYDPKARLIPYQKFNQDFLEQYSYLTLVNGFWSDTFLNINQEILNPYMDKDFISYAYSIPSDLKIRKAQSRYLLKKMMHNKLPDFILKRKKDNWHAQTEFLVNREKDKYYHIINRLRERGILKFDISGFFKKCKFKADEKFWALLSLEILLEIFLDRNKTDEPPGLDKF